jgi:HAD superfamily hydrolase (TIGR01509 family)
MTKASQYGVLFDFDGVMVDTEPIYSEAMEKMFNDRGKTFVLDIKRRMMGTGGLVSMSIMKESLGLTESPEELLAERGDIYREVLHTKGVRPMPGLSHAISLVNGLGFKKAIASSSRLEWIEFALERLDLIHEFETVVHSGEVVHCKPAPDIFVLAAKKLGLSVSNCVVLEDTVTGLSSARAAGMKCIVIPNQYTKGMDFSTADVVIGSLKELTEEMIVELLYGVQ